MYGRLIVLEAEYTKQEAEYATMQYATLSFGHIKGKLVLMKLNCHGTGSPLLWLM